jgi:hypothetical protein
METSFLWTSWEIKEDADGGARLFSSLQVIPWDREYKNE